MPDQHGLRWAGIRLQGMQIPGAAMTSRTAACKRVPFEKGDLVDKRTLGSVRAPPETLRDGLTALR